MSEAESQDPVVEADAAALARRIRLMMVISGGTTFLAVAVVLGVIGYRLFRSEGSPSVAAGRDQTVMLPKGARVVSTAVSDGKLFVTVERGGAVEIRAFDAKTLQAAGALRFASEP